MSHISIDTSKQTNKNTHKIVLVIRWQEYLPQLTAIFFLNDSLKA